MVIAADDGGERHGDSILAAVSRPVVVLLALALMGCGGGSQSASKAPAAPAPPSNGCQKVSPPAPHANAKLPKPHLALNPGKTYVATVATSCGSFQIRLDPRRAPKTGGSFLYLVRHRFFDGLTFHRVSPGFVIQGGDPKGDGSGGPGYTIVERPPAGLQYVRGVVAMAKTGADPSGASGSQFFVVTAQTTPLPAQYALLGKVTAGMDSVDRIGALEVDQQERPLQTVLIRSIRVKVSG
jgi:peptidyl-prolyl cis-trans isomerase B (cyclophilin B)